MITTSAKRFLIVPVLALCLFFSFFAVVSAQSCSASNTTCPTGKVCNVAQGQCQTAIGTGGGGTGVGTGGGGTGIGTGGGGTPIGTGGGTSGGTDCGGALCNPLKVDSLEGLLGLLIDAAVQLGTIVLVLALVYVGFLFVASRGQEEKIRDARRYFFWIVIGGLLVLGAKGLSEVIKSTATTLGS